MCATFQFQKLVFKPGKNVVAVGTSGLVRHVWAGFARAEILEWWQRKGGVLLDIYADRFATVFPVATILPVIVWKPRIVSRKLIRCFKVGLLECLHGCLMRAKLQSAGSKYVQELFLT